MEKYTEKSEMKPKIENYFTVYTKNCMWKAGGGSGTMLNHFGLREEHEESAVSTHSSSFA